MASFQAFQNPPPPAQETLTENQTGSCGAARVGGGGRSRPGSHLAITQQSEINKWDRLLPVKIQDTVAQALAP